ncbi:MAG: adenine deaminase [Bacteroidales bacterium]|jgi:adenine deaminase|nr:adenine deaminase [Bacteroidales bacterium]
MKTNFKVSGNIVDVVGKRIFKGTVIVNDGKIIQIRQEPVSEQEFILPGLIDAHIHIESSMLIPSEFARLAVVHGTVGTVSDPHEIANVLGIPGIKFMIENGKKVPFKFNFGAPSCVPATSFETAGASLGVKEVEELLQMPEIKYLSEMMNFPGVLFKDTEVMQKLELARKAGKPVDGHAPGVTGADAEKYIKAGISTDHECFSLEEAREKIAFGMKILIREGSAAKNFETLSSLIDEFPDQVMLCSDDKHPNDLERGHINLEVKRALRMGFEAMNVLRCCTFNPVNHYHLDIGLLQPGDPADFIRVDNLTDFNVLETYIDGEQVAENGKSLIEHIVDEPFNRFETEKIETAELHVVSDGTRIRVQKALDGQLITEVVVAIPKTIDEKVISDPLRDILKLVVKNRYFLAPASVGFISGFGLKKGALASCVAHDSHNIVAVGTDDESIAVAINMIIESKGGISLVDGETRIILPLPFAGIMSGEDGYFVARKYDMMDKKAREMGSMLTAPYMTLSFMALLVIPALKLSDKGLFDGTRFAFTEIFEK